MSMFAVGINHKTAPLAIREKIYFSLERMSLYLQDLLNRGLAREAVLLSTCNRSELYCDTHDINEVLNWFFAQTQLSVAELQPATYVFADENAIAHMMAVASGLDSIILGESQILGQMKAAFSESCAAGAVNTCFNRLFQQIFAVAKEIRTSTAIGACPVSVASAAVHFAKNQNANFKNANVVIVGAGDLSQLLVRYLNPIMTSSITIVNRSLDKIIPLFTDNRLYAFDQLQEALITADIVFTATGSATPIIDKDFMLECMEVRQSRPILLLDVAVPRDVDAEVANLPHVHLYCIDDLKEIIEHNRQGREHAANKARELIQQKSRDLMVEIKSFDIVAETIRIYRSQIEDICQEELLKAKRQLKQGIDPDKVLDYFAYAYTNKMLHTPSVQLRQAGVEGRFELLNYAKQLFAIRDVEIENL